MLVFVAAGASSVAVVGAAAAASPAGAACASVAASVFEVVPSAAVFSVFVLDSDAVSVLDVPSVPVAIVAVPVVVVAAAVVAALSSGQPIRLIANIETSARRIIIPFCAFNIGYSKQSL